MKSIEVRKVTSEGDRTLALAVVDEVYRQEKRWISTATPEIPSEVAQRQDQSWFLVTVDEEPAGVIRLLYDPPLELPKEFEVSLEPEIDLARLSRSGRFVEIGRFMILPRHRRSIRVVLTLMRGAIREVVARRYTHFLTDVFQDDPHSPLGFHTRVLGFERIGTHRHGDLECESLRIVLVLDIAQALGRLEERGDKIWKELGEGLRDLMVEDLPGLGSAPQAPPVWLPASHAEGPPGVSRVNGGGSAYGAPEAM